MCGSCSAHLSHDFPRTALSADVCSPRVVTGQVADRLMSQREAFRASTVDWQRACLALCTTNQHSHHSREGSERFPSLNQGNRTLQTPPQRCSRILAPFVIKTNDGHF